MKEKILVCYYSRTGLSRFVAEMISNQLNCDIEEIRTYVDYSGLAGYLRALTDVVFKNTPPVNQPQKLLTNYDLIIIGGPVWGASIAAPIRSFLIRNKYSFKNLACFSTQGGPQNSKKYFSQISDLVNIEPIAQMSISNIDIKNKKYSSILKFTALIKTKKEIKKLKIVPKTKEPSEARMH